MAFQTIANLNSIELPSCFAVYSTPLKTSADVEHYTFDALFANLSNSKKKKERERGQETRKSSFSTLDIACSSVFFTELCLLYELPAVTFVTCGLLVETTSFIKKR